jgi:hypothetical protein
MIIEYINKIMRTRTININDIFFGSEQSKYAGIALFMTILILCMIILFSSSRIPIGDRFIFVLFILIISVPSILMSLFELTCIVTGGNSTTRWWCWLLAWVLSVIIIVYCVMIIISMLISMSEYDMANDRLDYAIDKNKMNKEDANIYAKKLITQHEMNKSQENQRENEVYHTPIISVKHPNVHHVPHEPPHEPPPQHDMNTSLHGSESQPPHYKEPKVKEMNNMPYPKISSDVESDDMYMTYPPSDNMQKPTVSSPVRSTTQSSPANNLSSLNGYDNSDNYSSY